MLLEGLRNRPVTVWGNGIEGRAATVFLEGRNCTVTVVEDPEPIPFSGIIVRSPGISVYRNDFRTARQYGAVFTTGTNLFMEAALLQPDFRPLLIGITGTKGKSTTSALVAHLLRAQGNRVALCGNIGDPAIAYANHLEDYEVVVVEMSSYQCADLQYGFDISVVLNLYPEHIDWHKTHEQYFHDKLNILEHRNPEQVAILNSHDALTAMYAKDPKNAIYFDALDTIHVLGDYFYKGTQKLFKTNAVPLRGEHNLVNVCAALTVVEQAGGDLFLCEEALKSFKPLPHRLQNVAIKNGVTYVDDSISTTPETAIAAMKSFGYSRIILIAGGFDREQDYTKLASFVAKAGTKVIALPQTGVRLAEAVSEAGGEAVLVRNMQDAVAKAVSMARFGDIVLLSPAAPSYGVYKNFEERGQAFAKYVNELE
ncbi:MAG: UDP-N-acetylmuramoyl-L-alanine--D-glutamate ligase [Alphaproteobacteria bacterium]|nr:UDP-N-acetylmuramoyl-L-alanine--D-glutamate ligase [Alphaproteobacteria bacterium]